MSNRKLRYLSVDAFESLNGRITDHLEQYVSGDFQNLMQKGGWDLPLSVYGDLDYLSELKAEASAKSDLENSILVWKALSALTPALACENRLWTRLSHLEGLEYSRKRWLTNKESDQLVKSIATHFFAPTLTGCRDDHSIARLWWNAKIAKDLWPSAQREALELILHSTDIRSNFIERSWTVGRPVLARAILEMMKKHSWLIDHDHNFREFMKVINHRGGGIVFELLSDLQLQTFMDKCYEEAHSIREAA